MYKIEPIKGKCDYEMSFHNYELVEETIEIPLNLNKANDSEEEIGGGFGQIRVIGSENLVYMLSD